MRAALFVTNGHGEIAIAARIAEHLHRTTPIACDHLALVGTSWYPALHDVGPRGSMPSGGLIAMGNVRNILHDVSAGLLSLGLAQWRFLRSVRGKYCAAVAVGDVLALVAALQADARATVFVGTAKSVRVARYGPLERAIIRRANAVFVRDVPTAEDLQRSGIDARSANVIADFATSAGRPDIEGSIIAIFPGSREAAYEDALFLLSVIRLLSREERSVRAVLSVAPTLRASRFADMLAQDGWRIVRHDDRAKPFSAFDGEREVMTAYTAPGEELLNIAHLVLGQAGTMNEAAAAAGVPVVAFVPESERRQWYRRRQTLLLGDALLILPRDAGEGARAVGALLHDPQRMSAMSHAGKKRMSSPGATAAIVDCIGRLCA